MGAGFKELVDCGPGNDIVHIYFRGLGAAPYPLSRQLIGAEVAGRLVNCEVVYGDDVTHPDNPQHGDITAAWVNAGTRTARRGGATPGKAGIERDTFRLGDGDDFFDITAPVFFLQTGRPLLVLGRAGNDVIAGGPLSDHLEGEDGNDTLDGRGGDDLLYGRTGDDKAYGREGNDLLEGGRGKDLLKGGPGADTINGGFDADRLYGGSGDDRLTSIDGTRDVIDCGSGHDDAAGDRHDVVRGCEHVSR